MIREHYTIPSGGFGEILAKIKEILSLFGDSDKMKSLIKYIQWNRLKLMLMMEPQKVQHELLPYFEQQLWGMK